MDELEIQITDLKDVSEGLGGIGTTKQATKDKRLGDLLVHDVARALQQSNEAAYYQMEVAAPQEVFGQPLYEEETLGEFMAQTPVAPTPQAAAQMGKRVVTPGGNTVGMIPPHPQRWPQAHQAQGIQGASNQQFYPRARVPGPQQWEPRPQWQPDQRQSGAPWQGFGRGSQDLKKIRGTGYLQGICNLCRNGDHDPTQCKRTATQYQTIISEIYQGKIPPKVADLAK